MSSADSYRHLNDTDKFTMKLDIEDVADMIVHMNYGVHRLLSAIVRKKLQEYPCDEMALGIKKLLDKGLF